MKRTDSIKIDEISREKNSRKNVSKHTKFQMNSKKVCVPDISAAHDDDGSGVVKSMDAKETESNPSGETSLKSTTSECAANPQECSLEKKEDISTVDVVVRVKKKKEKKSRKKKTIETVSVVNNTSTEPAANDTITASSEAKLLNKPDDIAEKERHRVKFVECKNVNKKQEKENNVSNSEALKAVIQQSTNDIESHSLSANNENKERKLVGILVNKDKGIKIQKKFKKSASRQDKMENKKRANDRINIGSTPTKQVQADKRTITSDKNAQDHQSATIGSKVLNQRHDKHKTATRKNQKELIKENASGSNKQKFRKNEQKAISQNNFTEDSSSNIVNEGVEYRVRESSLDKQHSDEFESANEESQGEFKRKTDKSNLSPNMVQKHKICHDLKDNNSQLSKDFKHSKPQFEAQKNWDNNVERINNKKCKYSRVTSSKTGMIGNCNQFLRDDNQHAAGRTPMRLQHCEGDASKYPMPRKLQGPEVLSREMKITPGRNPMQEELSLDESEKFEGFNYQKAHFLKKENNRSGYFQNKSYKEDLSLDESEESQQFKHKKLGYANNGQTFLQSRPYMEGSSNDQPMFNAPMQDILPHDQKQFNRYFEGETTQENSQWLNKNVQDGKAKNEKNEQLLNFSKKYFSNRFTRKIFHNYEPQHNKEKNELQKTHEKNYELPMNQKHFSHQQSRFHKMYDNEVIPAPSPWGEDVIGNGHGTSQEHLKLDLDIPMKTKNQKDEKETGSFIAFDTDCSKRAKKIGFHHKLKAIVSEPFNFKNSSTKDKKTQNRMQQESPLAQYIKHDDVHEVGSLTENCIATCDGKNLQKMDEKNEEYSQILCESMIEDTSSQHNIHQYTDYLSNQDTSTKNLDNIAKSSNSQTEMILTLNQPSRENLMETGKEYANQSMEVEYNGQAAELHFNSAMQSDEAPSSFENENAILLELNDSEGFFEKNKDSVIREEATMENNPLFNLDNYKNEKYKIESAEADLTLDNDYKQETLDKIKSQNYLKKLKPIYIKRIIINTIKEKFWFLCLPLTVVIVVLSVVFGLLLSSQSQKMADTETIGNLMVLPNIQTAPPPIINGTLRVVAAQDIDIGLRQYALTQSNAGDEWKQNVLSKLIKEIFSEAGLTTKKVLITRLSFLSTDELEKMPRNFNSNPVVIEFELFPNEEQDTKGSSFLENLLRNATSVLKYSKKWQVDPKYTSLAQRDNQVSMFTVVDFLSLDVPPLDFRVNYESESRIINATGGCPKLVIPDDVIVSPFVCRINELSPPELVCRFSCEKNSTIIGAESIACLASGVWSGSEPVCSRTCRVLPPLKNGRIIPSLCTSNDSNNTIPAFTQCIHYCNENHKLIGPFQRQCGPNGMWTFEEPACKKECPIFPPLTHGGIAPPRCLAETSVVGEVCVFACSGVFVLQGEEAVTCDKNGRWTHGMPACRKTCSSLERVPNAVVMPEECSTAALFEGMSCIYSCDEGFRLVGSHIRSCTVNQLWTGEPPLCIRVCPPLNEIAHGAVSPITCATHEQLALTECKFSCEDGLVLNGKDKLTCSEDGIWNEAEPTCIVQCPTVSTPQNGILYCSNTTTNSSCALHCLEGYRLLGTGFTVCRDDGIWSELLGVCIETCPKVHLPAYGSAKPIECGLVESVVNETCVFSCDASYGLGGSAIRTCMKDRMWSGSNTSCSRESLHFLTLEENGIRVCLSADGVYSTMPEKRSIHDCTGRPFDYWSIYRDHMLKNAGNGLCIGFMTVEQMSKLVFLPCNLTNTRLLWEFPFSTSSEYTLKLKHFPFYLWYGYSSAPELVAINSYNLLTKWLFYNPATQSKTTFFGVLNNGKCPTLARHNLGEWLPKDCSQFPSYPGATCTFICKLGFKPILQSNVAKCVTGIWQGNTNPMCNPSCSGYNISLVTDGMVTPQDACLAKTHVDEGTTCTIACDKDFSLTGEMNTACLADGIWSTDAPNCTRYCLPVDPPSNGFVISTISCTHPTKNQKVGSICQITCKNGYVVRGINTVTCLESGDWDSENYTCVRACYPPPPPKMGHVICNEEMEFYPEGTTCHYNCTEDRVLYPNSKSETTCLSIGTWDKYPPSCQVLCPQLQDISNGRVEPGKCTNSSFLPNDFKCYFFCDSGYTLQGETIVECLPSGRWNKYQPTCIADTHFTIIHSSGMCLVAENFPYRNEYKVVSNQKEQCDNRKLLQRWTVNSFNQIRNVETRWCLTVSNVVEGEEVKMVDCDSSKRRQRWECILAENYTLIRLIDTNFALQTKKNYVYISREYSHPSTISWTTREVGTQRVGTLCGMVHNGGTCPVITASHGTELTPLFCQTPVSVNTSCVVTCKNKYELMSGKTKQTIICNQLGVWSKYDLYCKKRTCPPLPALPANTKVSNLPCTKEKFDAFHRIPCIYTCSSGFYKDLPGGASDELYCLGNGEWSEKVPKCKAYCDGLTIPANGAVTPLSQCTRDTSAKQGQICTFICNPHFGIKGPKFLHCSNGTWNGTAPTCQALTGSVRCRGFGTVANARIFPLSCYSRRVPYNTKCYVNCTAGYQLFIEKQPESICQANGFWSSPLPPCKRICPPYIAPPNSHLEPQICNDTDIITEGQECLVVCDRGYSLFTSGVQTCHKDGNWDKHWPQCKPNPQFLLQIDEMCAFAPVENNSYVYFTRCSMNNASHLWEWIDTHKLRNVKTQTCIIPEDSSSYSSVRLIECNRVNSLLDCPYSSDQEEGLMFNKSLRLAKVKANMPTKLFVVKSTEDDSGWKDKYTTKLTAYNETVTTFVRPCLFRLNSNCPSLPNVTNGFIEYRCRHPGLNVFIGTKCTYFCNQGYLLVGIAERQCQDNGEWSSTSTVQCKKLCSSLQQPDFGSVFPSKCTTDYMYEGEACQFVCDDDYLLAGTAKRYCQPDGQWSGKSVICHKACPSLLSIPYLPPKPFISPETCASQEQHMGTKCLISCPFGYGLNGSDTRTCLYSGNWFGYFQACERSCTSLATVLNGKVSPSSCVGSDNFAGNACIFTCDSGYRIRGETTLKCNSDGFWSSPLPKCLKRCPVLERPPNGYNNCSSSKSEPVVGDVCGFNCELNYVVVGSQTRTCLETSLWSNAQPSCEREYQFALFQSSPGTSERCLAVQTNEKLAMQEENCDFNNNISIHWAWHNTHLIRHTQTLLCLAGNLLRQGSYLILKTCNQNDREQIWEGSEPERNWFFRLKHYGLYPLYSLLSSKKVLLFSDKSLDVVLSDSMFGHSRHTHWYAKTAQVARLPVGAARKLSTCEQLNIPQKTIVTPNSCSFQPVSVGTSCYFSCETGYKLNRQIVLTECLVGGLWSHAVPLCVPACSPFNLQTSEALKVNPPSCSGNYRHPEGFVCRFSCPPNALLSGNPVLTCQKNNKWNYMTPQCIATCPAVNILQHGKVTPHECTAAGKRLNEGTQCSYECLHSTLILTESPIRVCTKYGFWDQPEGRCVKPCPLHLPPIGGYVKPLSCSTKPSLHGSLCSFTCQPHLIQKGPAFRICLANGSWVGQMPQCQAACPRLQAPANSIVNPGSCLTGIVSPEQVCTLGCVSGFEIRGAEITECLHNGTWSRFLGECSVSCPKLFKPLNGLIDPKSCLGGDIYYRHQCAITCERGYALRGSPIRVCLIDGTWSGEEAVCEEACYPIGPGINTQYFPESCENEFQGDGSICQTTCKDSTTTRSGLTFSDASCNEGTWDDESLVACYKICPSPLVKNGEVECVERNGLPTLVHTISTTCQVTCKDDYVADTEYLSTCILTSEEAIWNPPLTTCSHEPDPMIIINRVGLSVVCLGTENNKVVSIGWQQCQKFAPNMKWVWHSEFQIRNAGTGQCLDATHFFSYQYVTVSSCNQDNELQQWTCSDTDPFLVRLKGQALYIDTNIEKVVVLTAQNFSSSKLYTYNPRSPDHYGTICSKRSLSGKGNICVLPKLPAGASIQTSCAMSHEIKIGTKCFVICSEALMQTITCLANGLWLPPSELLCIEPCNPYASALKVNATFKEEICLAGPIPFNYYCALSCSPGYVLVGKDRGSTCIHGKRWSTMEDYSCQIGCEEIKTVPNGVLDPQKCNTGTCSLRCFSGYRVDGPVYRECLESGWSGRNFRCVAEVQFSIVSLTSYKLHSLCLETESLSEVVKRECSSTKKAQKWRWNSHFTIENVITRECLAVDIAYVRSRTAVDRDDVTFEGKFNDSDANNIIPISLSDNKKNPVVAKSCNAIDFTQRWTCGSGAHLRLLGRNAYLDAGALFQETLHISNRSNSATTRWSGRYHTGHRSICAFRHVETCPPLADVLFGRIVPSHCMFKYVTGGTRCRYMCNTNFVLQGSSVTTCLRNGKWSQTPPSCLGIRTCPTLQPKNHLQISPLQCITGLAEQGQVCNMKCSGNTVLIGKESLTCLPSRYWDGAIPTCFTVCPALLPPDGGVVHPPECELGYVFPSLVCHSECKENRILSGGAARICSADGTWEGENAVCKPTCPPLVAPTNGKILPVSCTIGNITTGECVFSCYYGYALSSKGRLVCNGGLWSDVIPSCEDDLCERVKRESDAIGRVEYDGLVNGAIVATSVLKVNCNFGYESDEPVYRVCLSSGRWSGGSEGCKKQSCPELNKLYSGEVTPQNCSESKSGLPVGTVCFFTCKSGYVMKGPTSKECLLGGTWSNPELTVACQDTRPKANPSTFIIQLGIELKEGTQVKLCLQTTSDNEILIFQPCDVNNFHQRWKWFGSSQLKSLGSDKCLRIETNLQDGKDINDRYMFPGTCLFNNSLHDVRCGDLDSPAEKLSISIGDVMLGPEIFHKSNQLYKQKNLDKKIFSLKVEDISLISWSGTWVDYTRDQFYKMTNMAGDPLNPICSFMCGGNYFGEKGDISSPNYPNRYPTNVHCVWLIDTPAKDHELVLDFSSISLQNNHFSRLRQGKCSQDYLEIIEEKKDTSVSIMQLCTNATPFRVGTYFGRMRVIFHSDNIDQGNGGTGWSAKWWSRPIPKSHQYCGDYSIEFLPNFKQNSRQAFSARWQAIVVWRVRNVCNAVIYNEYFVITSAHCVENFHRRTLVDDAIPVQVIYGIKDQGDLISKYQMKKGNAARKVWLHPHYSPTHYTNDIALIMTQYPIARNARTQPICFPTLKDPKVILPGYSLCWAVQWSRKLFTRIQSNWDFTHYSYVKLLPHDECQQLLQRHKEVEHIENLLCARDSIVPPKSSLASNRLSSSPEDDEGSFLQCRWNENWYLVGISAFTFEDDYNSYLYVYTRSRPYEPWIAATTKNAFFSLRDEYMDLFS